MMNLPTTDQERAAIAERLCTHFFEPDARSSPGFRDMLSKQVERVLEVAACFEPGERPDYDALNTLKADGVILQGLIALNLIDPSLAARWQRRMVAFYEALATRMAGEPEDKKLGEVLSEQDAIAVWEQTSHAA